MTPERTSKNGTYRFDRVFPGVGRIHCASGTTKLKEFQRRDQLLTELYEHAQLEALRAFQRGDVTIAELLDAKRAGRITSAALVADIALRGNLWSTLEQIFPTDVDRTQKTALRYRVSLEGFMRKARPLLGEYARVSDLARADWLELQRAWGKSPADWNHMRRMISTALTQLLGDVYHPFRRRIVKAIPVASEQSRTPDLSASLFWKIVSHAPEHVQPAYVALIASGMRVGEYLACTRDDLLPITYAINVPGTKTEGSAAIVYVDQALWPWITAAVPAPVTYKYLRRYWVQACIEAGAGRRNAAGRYVGLRIHDLRHAFAQLASDAGESTARIQVAMRHAGPEMTRRYEMQKARKDVAQAVGGALLLKQA